MSRVPRAAASLGVRHASAQQITGTPGAPSATVTLDGKHLPRKLVATFHRDGHPQVRIAFSAWNLTAPVTAADFTFTPPKGAQKIEMWTTARMQAAR